MDIKDEYEEMRKDLVEARKYGEGWMDFIVKCPICGKKVETVMCQGVQKYFDTDGSYHECEEEKKNNAIHC